MWLKTETYLVLNTLIYITFFKYSSQNGCKQGSSNLSWQCWSPEFLPQLQSIKSWWSLLFYYRIQSPYLFHLHLVDWKTCFPLLVFYRGIFFLTSKQKDSKQDKLWGFFEHIVALWTQKLLTESFISYIWECLIKGRGLKHPLIVCVYIINI